MDAPDPKLRTEEVCAAERKRYALKAQIAHFDAEKERVRQEAAKAQASADRLKAAAERNAVDVLLGKKEHVPVTPEQQRKLQQHLDTAAGAGAALAALDREQAIVRAELAAAEIDFSDAVMSACREHRDRVAEQFKAGLELLRPLAIELIAIDLAQANLVGPKPKLRADNVQGLWSSGLVMQTFLQLPKRVAPRNFDFASLSEAANAQANHIKRQVMEQSQ